MREYQETREESKVGWEHREGGFPAGPRLMSSRSVRVQVRVGAGFPGLFHAARTLRELVRGDTKGNTSVPEEGLDLTQPRISDRAGFIDLGGAYRHAADPVRLVPAGPVLVQLQCVERSGFAKTFSLFAGQPWVEVTLNVPAHWFRNYADPGLRGVTGRLPPEFATTREGDATSSATCRVGSGAAVPRFAPGPTAPPPGRRMW